MQSNEGQDAIYLIPNCLRDLKCLPTCEYEKLRKHAKKRQLLWPFFNTIFQFQPRFPKHIPKTLSSEAWPGNEWRIIMTKRPAHSSYFMQDAAGGGNDGQSWGNCSVGNMGTGLRTLEYQTNETEQLLEEKATRAFKDAVKTHGRAGHEVQNSWFLAAFNWKLQLDNAWKRLILKMV